ncbi:MAG: hypothetical protein ACI9M6_000626 [Hydrogenophaga sp.]|jgi:hypothetical protein
MATAIGERRFGASVASYSSGVRASRSRGSARRQMGWRRGCFNLQARSGHSRADLRVSAGKRWHLATHTCELGTGALQRMIIGILSMLLTDSLLGVLALHATGHFLA